MVKILRLRLLLGVDHHPDLALRVRVGEGQTHGRWQYGADPQLISALRNSERFTKLQTVVRVRSERYAGPEYTECTVEDRFFIGSATSQAAEALHAARTHWQIENSLHWVLDIGYREDESRIRKRNGQQSFAVLRHIALNALKLETWLPYIWPDPFAQS